MLNVAGRGVDQRLSVDASWGDLLKYNNIQELELDPETNQKLYKQYGRFLKFSQKQRSVDADYKLYVKRNEWSSSWIVDAAYTYYKAESEYTISPACYDQDLHYSKLMLGVTKNFRVQRPQLARRDGARRLYRLAAEPNWRRAARGGRSTTRTIAPTCWPRSMPS